MRSLMLIAAFLLLVAGGGCSLALMSPIERTDLSEVQAGATRAEVEAVLGGSVEQSVTASGSVEIYEYDRGDSAPFRGKALTVERFADYLGDGGLFHEFWLAPWALVERIGAGEDQRGSLAITYGPDDIIVRVEVAGSRDQRELKEEISVVRVGATREQVEGVLGEPDESESEDDPTVYVYRHRRGDAHEVMYVTYGPDGTVTRAETSKQRREQQRREAERQASPPSTTELFAPAQCGDLDKQVALGDRYAYGWGVPKKFVSAAFWYGLASKSGHKRAEAELANLEKQLTPAQIAEAELLVIEWKPDPTKCDLDSNVAKN